jgi:hypothetical protein
MNTLPITLDVVRKTLMLALLGFVVVTLSGLIGTILGFALVGLLVWGIAQIFVRGPRVAWDKTRGAVKSVAHFTFRAGRGILVAPWIGLYRAGRGIVRGVFFLVRGIVLSVWRLAAFSFGFVCEVATGLLLGGLVAAHLEGHTDFRVKAMLTGAMALTAFGAIVASSRKKKGKRVEFAAKRVLNTPVLPVVKRAD